MLAAFVVQLLGGRGSVPGWQQLRAVLGVPLQTEESAPQTADGSTVVYVLDVGQGDAVLLCQDGAYCLIDTGPSRLRTRCSMTWTCWVCRRLSILC